jgi:anionic cell wall polymer biosynthesis LytR-Cps2A-Psr (LCP) family protein
MRRISRRGLRLKAGVNHLDGTRALAFARTRKADSDYQRAARQQQLLVATTAKVLELGPEAIPALAGMAFRHLETDLPPSALPVLVELAGRARLRNPKSIVLAPGTYAGPGPVVYTIQLRLDAVRSMFDRLFGPV